MRPESIRVHRGLAIPLAEIRLRTSRSSGPGGQHAQKTETRVEASFDVDASATLSDGQKARIKARAGPVVRAVAQDERSQWRNRELALERLAAAIRDALRRERRRRPTKPTRASRKRRLEEKRARGRTKRLRRPPADEARGLGPQRLSADAHSSTIAACGCGVDWRFRSS